MTKEVFVSIEGSQPDLNEETLAIMVPGVYHQRNVKQYIQFDETTDDGKGMIQNMLRIADDQVDISKKGALNSQMIFQIEKETVANYETPYGNLLFQIHTHVITVEESTHEIKVFLNYTLSMEESHISENTIQIIIKAKE